MSPTVICDTEWGYRDGRVGAETAWEPVVLVARVDGADHHFAGRDDRLRSFAASHRDHLWVAHSASAEMRYLMRMGIDLPPRWYCTQVGWRHASNRSGYLESSLIAALRGMNLHYLIPADKEEIRQAILHLKFGEDDWPRIVAYCAADVRATEAIYNRLSETGAVRDTTMAYHTEYLRVVAKIEQRGIPIDVDTLGRIWRYREHVQDALRRRVNKTIRVYRRNGSFSRAAFWDWVDRQGIRWPVTLTARGGWVRSMDDDTLRVMGRRYAEIRTLRETRETIRAMQSYPMMVDALNGRHYYSLMPFRSVTGRNQPRRYVFGAPKWMRFLITPRPGRVLAYMDYTAQEIGIAAALSGDPNMWRMYQSRDPHMEFAIMAGAAPPGATKDTHREVREVYKVVNLAVLYGQSAEGIAAALGIAVSEAQALLVQHQDLFRVYHRWSRSVVLNAYHRGRVRTRLAWVATVDHDTRRRTWANFPIQGAGAEIMRCTSIAMDRVGIEILGIVHDGWLLECAADEVDDMRHLAVASAEWACDRVLGGYKLSVDWTTYTDRFREDAKTVREMWEYILDEIPKKVLRVKAD